MRLISGFFIVLFLVSNYSNAQLALDSGLVAHYKLDGNVLDSGPLAIDGTPVSIVETDGLGCPGQAYLFNGVDSGVLCDTNNRGITNRVTISAYVKLTSTGVGDVVNKYAYEEDKGFHFQINNGGVAIGGRDNSGTYHFSGFSTTLVNDGEWHHILGIVDSNEWKVWVDCSLEAVYTSSTSDPLLSSIVELAIGQDNWEPDEFFDGTIEDVRIYNRMLTPDEKAFLCDTSLLTYLEVESCGDYVSPSGDEIYSTTGLYYDTIPAMMGCDSILALDVTISSVNDSIIVGTDSLTAFQDDASYQWINCVSGLPLDDETNQSIETPADGSYACIVTSGSCVDTTDCITTDCFVVDDLADSVELCDGETTLLDGTIDSEWSYEWSTGSVDSAISVSSAGLYTITATKDTCTYIDSVLVSVEETPAVDAGTDSMYCGGLVTLTGMGTATDYSWSGGVTDGDPFTPLEGTFTYYLTGTIDSTGCENIDSVEIEYAVPPEVNAGEDTTLCGEPITLSGFGTATDYSWSGGVTDGDEFYPPIGTTEYIVTGVIDSTGCSSSDTVIVVFGLIPIVNAGEDTALCEEPVTLSSSGTATDYSWSDGVIDGEPFYSPEGTTTYILTGVVDSTGCEATDDINVTVTTVDETIYVLGDKIVSNEDDATSYQWINCKGFIPFPGETDQSFTIPGGTGSYAVIVTVGECVDTSDCISFHNVGLSDDDQSNKWMVYPNPSSGKVNLKNLTDSRLLTKIIGLDGKVYLSKNLQSGVNIIDLTGFEAGVYLIRFSKEDGSSQGVKKLIIE